MADRIENHSILAWVGEDEHGSGVVGLKQALTRVGLIALVAMDYHQNRLAAMKSMMEAQAELHGKKIRLVRFVFAEQIDETKAGT